MPRRLTPHTLENLKRDAKRWLKALRENVDEARARFRRAFPDAPDVFTLRDVQHALARELGFEGWSALKAKITASAPEIDEHEILVRRFLDNACPDHHVRGPTDHVRAQSTAMRLLARYPEIAHASFATAIVCGDIATVERMLDERPQLAKEKDAEATEARTGSGDSGDLYTNKELGPKGWEPLHFLTFTRLSLPAANGNAFAIARLLLDRGANPNASFPAGGSGYTPLVGAIGEGEEDRPPHPERDALVRLLLERGAEPYDGQVVYNIHFHGKVLWFMELIYERAVALGRQSDWDNPEWPMFDMGGYGSGARWHLQIAIDHNDLALAEWCLTHGASANAAPPSDKRLARTSLYEQAVRRGEREMAELLVRHGATRTNVVLEPVEAFTAAAMRLDRTTARSLADAHPALLRSAAPLIEAAKQDRADVAELLLDLGTSPNVENERKERALHYAGYNNAVNVATLLIARGADIDPTEARWSNTPLAAARWAQHQPMIDLLSEYSRDVWELTSAGKLKRLREILRESPERARVSYEGHTPLMWLPPEDESNAMAVARLFLAHGADPSVRNSDRMTAADRAERLGMFDLAAMLREAETAKHRPTLDRYERMAVNLLDAYRTGTPEAMQRHWADTWHRREWQAMRRYVQLDLGKRPATEDGNVELTLNDARLWVARDHAFESWDALEEFVTSLPPSDRITTATPVRTYAAVADDESDAAMSSRDWDSVIETIRDKRLTAIDAAGQMTDEMLERLVHVPHLTALRLGGSRGVTDEGVRHLVRLPQLERLDLSGTSITDRGLEVLRELTGLASISLAWTRVTDAGVPHLERCERLERVDLMGTHTGDGALRALAGKTKLCELKTGALVSDDGIPILQEYPVFKTWQNGQTKLALLSPVADPNFLFLRGTFTDRGVARLVGLDGLFALNIDDVNLAITPASLVPLATLPHLGLLAFDATDEAMPHITALPSLRFLMCQDTPASDDGFVALSKSKTIEYIWGRRCHGLRNRGFVALGTMPALRGLSVSCKNVEDVALAALPSFPSLRELMPMDVPDESYRHIGQCADLESLLLMYCRDTGDIATSHITGLTRLTKYFNSYTKITDRTPELLSGISSLERIELAACPGVTNAGVTALARLPNLRELRLSGMQAVAAEMATQFPPRVRVRYSL